MSYFFPTRFFPARRRAGGYHPNSKAGPERSQNPGSREERAAVKNIRQGLDVRILLPSLFALLFFVGGVGGRAAPLTLAERLQAVLSRPEFRHAIFGIEFYSLDTGEVLYALNADKLFVPASTTKLLTEGTALELLGADYSFHTRVYRTGLLEAHGALKGDLVLVASGDPNLSARVQPDGTLAFENVDHAYAGSPDTRAVPGDPLGVIRELARQVAGRGVRRIDGRVLVDASLFPEGERELGTGIFISPVIVNDNIVDVMVGPGESVGAPARLQVSPATAYVQFTNQVKTGLPNSKPEVNWTNDVTRADGSHAVVVAGSVPAGKPAILFAYPVSQPSRFAEFTLSEALRKTGITTTMGAPGEKPDFKALAASYSSDRLLAEHVSPPLAEEVKVTLKVSQNLHASIMPYLFGAVMARQQTEIAQAGFDREREFLQRAGLDLSGAAQTDGAGGAPSGSYTPDFMVQYLASMARRKDFPVFLNALPVLGRDGTLWNIRVGGPAAGHVQAKTGTLVFYNALNRNLMVTGKGLAGYLTTPHGKRWAFAIYANHVSVPMDEESITRIVGQTLGEIAEAGYLAAVEGDAK